MCELVPCQEPVEPPLNGRQSLHGPPYVVSSAVITFPPSGPGVRTSAVNRVLDRHFGLTVRTSAMCELVPCQEPVEPPLNGRQSLHGPPYVVSSVDKKVSKSDFKKIV